MPNIQIEVAGKYARSPVDEIVCGNSDYYIEFRFSDEWDAFEVKTARFNYGNISVDATFRGDVVKCPKISNATMLEVGVYAGDLSTTTPALVKCRKSILCKNGMPPDPTPSVYAEILALLAEVNKGGTTVTVDGEVVTSFPADTYIAERIAALVNSAPATLDTLAEIATALGNDPNFATTIMAMLGNKVDKVGRADVVLGTDGAKNPASYPFSDRANAWTMAYRRALGALRVGTATDGDDAVNLAQMNEALATMAGKISGEYKVPCTDGGGNQITYGYSQSPNGYTFALRRSGGVLDVGRATKDDEAVPFGQLNEILAERIGDISAALDEVHAYAQALKGGAN